MAQQPQLKSSQLLEEFNRLTRTGRLDDLAASRFKREAEKIRPTDPVGASMLAGALASQMGDVVEMERQHQIAIRNAPGLVEAHANYAICLYELGFLTRATDEMNRAHRLAPTDPRPLTNAFEFAIGSGAFVEALQLAEELQRLGVDVVNAKIAGLQNVVQFLADKPGVPAEMQRLESLLGEVMRAFRQILFQVDVSILSDEESEWLSAWWEVIAEPGQIADLNWSLAEKLAEGPANSEISSRINMMFVSASLA